MVAIYFYLSVLYMCSLTDKFSWRWIENGFSNFLKYRSKKTVTVGFYNRPFLPSFFVVFHSVAFKLILIIIWETLFLVFFSGFLKFITINSKALFSV